MYKKKMIGVGLCVDGNDEQLKHRLKQFQLGMEQRFNDDLTNNVKMQLFWRVNVYVTN